MAADNGDNWAKKGEEHPCLSVFIRVLAKVSGSEVHNSVKAGGQGSTATHE